MLLAHPAVSRLPLPAHHMASTLFPSGDWYGFYTYHGDTGRHPMDIRFTFENGRVSACGGDPVGEFILTGAYDERNRECYWNKQYLGAHTVFYRGYRDGKGIWGNWELRGSKGGFHIWPLGGDEAVESEAEEKTEVQPGRAPAPTRARRSTD